MSRHFELLNGHHSLDLPFGTPSFRLGRRRGCCPRLQSLSNAGKILSICQDQPLTPRILERWNRAFPVRQCFRRSFMLACSSPLLPHPPYTHLIPMHLSPLCLCGAIDVSCGRVPSSSCRPRCVTLTHASQHWLSSFLFSILFHYGVSIDTNAPGFKISRSWVSNSLFIPPSSTPLKKLSSFARG